MREKPHGVSPYAASALAWIGSESPKPAMPVVSEAFPIYAGTSF